MSGELNPIWVDRNDGFEHVDAIDRELRARYSRFHGLMIAVDGHWVYVGDSVKAFVAFIEEHEKQR